MFLQKNLLIFWALVLYIFCEDLSFEAVSIDCDDETIILDENGTSDYKSFVTTSVRFYLLTPSNDSIELNSTNKNLVNTTQPTKILIHGFGSYDTLSWVDQMANVYHTNGNYNIVAVDWSKISVNDYIFLASVVDSVGKVIGDFIIDITEDSVERLTGVHLIGSSVGAQIGGAAGEVVAKNGTKVGRITGLDPTVPDLEVLDEGDAEFVDVIHTSELYGNHHIGTVDFYVFADDPEHPVCFNDTCGELLAEDFFISSIEEGDRFEGISCYNNTIYLKQLCEKAHGIFMGEYVSKNATGSYLVSKDSAPGLHGQGKYILTCTAALIIWYLLK